MVLVVWKTDYRRSVLVLSIYAISLVFGSAMFRCNHCSYVHLVHMQLKSQWLLDLGSLGLRLGLDLGSLGLRFGITWE
jgi:hypothetical protein